MCIEDTPPNSDQSGMRHLILIIRGKFEVICFKSIEEVGTWE